MKQSYDVTSLLVISCDTEKMCRTCMEITKAVLAYSDTEAAVDNCLRDTFDEALCIAF